ncbi:MAG: serine/threonine protein kinase [Elusimicrobia bacterium]|nr:serine/threonine protein kinase [Elusimicrobiota bacterium]
MRRSRALLAAAALACAAPAFAGPKSFDHDGASPAGATNSLSASGVAAGDNAGLGVPVTSAGPGIQPQPGPGPGPVPALGRPAHSPPPRGHLAPPGATLGGPVPGVGAVVGAVLAPPGPATAPGQAGRERGEAAGLVRKLGTGASGGAGGVPPLAEIPNAAVGGVREGYFSRASASARASAAAAAAGLAAIDDLHAQKVVPPAQAVAAQRLDARSASVVREAASKARLGAWREVVEKATEALRLDPSNAEAFALRAEAYRRLDDLRRAAADAASSLQLLPNGAQALKVQVRLLVDQRRWQEARQALDGLNRLAPDDQEAWALAQWSHGHLRDVVRAAEAGENLRRLNPAYARQVERALASGRADFPEFEPESELEELGGGSRTRLGWLVLGLLGTGALLAGRRLAARRRDWSEGFKAQARQRPASPAEKYERLRVLARDAQGELAEALDRSLQRSVLLRRVPAADADAGERLLAGARTAAGLRHPAIADLYEAFHEGGEVWLVFESLRGKTARRMVEEAGRLPLAQALFVLRPVCEALDFAHGRGVAHRGLSLDAIVLTDQGQAKLTDFGLRAAEPGADGVRADLHDLAVCLYEMTTGARPFSDAGAADGRAGLALVPPSRRVPGLPPALDALAQDALAPAPEPRIRSAREFLARLQALGEVVAA